MKTINNNQVVFFDNKMTFLKENYEHPKTIESYSSRFRTIIRKKKKKINKDVIYFSLEEIDELLSNLPTTNIRVKKTVFSLLNCYFNWGINKEQFSLSENPMKKIDINKYLIMDKLKDKLYYSIEEIDRMCTRLEYEIGFNPQEIIPIIMARYGILGSKLSWIRSLRNEHIDRENYIVHIFDEKEEKIITSLPIDDIFLKWIDKALDTKEKVIESDSPSVLLPIRKLKYIETGYILKSNRGYKKVSEQGIYSAMNRLFYSIFDSRIRLTKLVNSRKFDLLFDKKIINGKITYNDFREVTAMFNTDSKKYSYFSLRDDYILLNGKNDIVDDFNFEKDYLNKLKK